MSQDEKKRHVTALMRKTNQSRTLCTRAIDEAGGYEEALKWINEHIKQITNAASKKVN